MLGKTFSGHFNGSDPIGLRARREGISLTLQQLQAARAEKWRQTGNALQTLDDARTWIEEAGLVFYLPRRAQLPIQAPSFVEAVLGQSNPTPPREAIERANEFLTRLAAEGVVIPLNLMGNTGDQPDYLVSTELLPSIFALRGDRDWKRGPQVSGVRSVSPLVSHVYESLDEKGSATLVELRDRLGSELTEAAILRALTELWAELRVVPVYADSGEYTRWELAKQRLSKSLAQGTSTSQLTAVSVLASLWIQTAIAASSEETEIFLSPLTSRSKIREVLRGLSAARQLELVSLGHSTYHFVAGSLPEFPELPEPEIETAPEPQTPSFERQSPRAFNRESGDRSPRRPRLGREESDAGKRPPRDFERRSRSPREESGAGRRGPDRDMERPARRSFSDRGERRERPAAFRRGDETSTGERPRFQRSSEGRSETRKFGSQTGRGQRPAKPWQSREDRPSRERQSGGYRREGTQNETRGRGPRNFEGGDTRPSRRPQGQREEFRGRGSRFEGRSEERPFNRPRSERPPQSREFPKRGEERGPRGFDKEGGARPPRRESSGWQSRNETTRERRPRVEDQPEGRSSGRSRFERPGQGRGFQKRDESRGGFRDFERRGSRPPRREQGWKPGEEGSREREARPRRESGPSSRPYSSKPRSERPPQREGKRTGGFGSRGDGPKASRGFGGKTGGRSNSASRSTDRRPTNRRPTDRPAKKFGRKERPE
jgi:23S rRNA pseudouridine2605 synthase